MPARPFSVLHGHERVRGSRYMVLPTLDCHGCKNRILLPYRNFRNSDLVEPYWPEDSTALQWVCSSCLHCTSHEQNEIDWVADTLIAMPHPDRGFWRIAIGCCGPGCSEMIVAYTDTIGKTSYQHLGTSLARAEPTPKCRKGHGPGTDWIPKSVDFVEWTGPVEYLH